MSKGGDQPQSPDYEKLIPEQEASDLRKYDYMLGGMRSATSGAGGKTYWKQTPNVDQSGYDQALAQFNANTAALSSTPRYVEQVAGGTGADDVGAFRGLVENPEWTKLTKENPRPDLKDFTKTDWEFISEMSPENQSMYDKAQGKLSELVDSDALLPETNLSGSYSDEVADAIWRRTQRYTQPEEDKARTALETRLAERGFQVGNAGYQTEMSRFDDRAMTADADAADRAQLGAQSQALQEATFRNNSKAQLASLLSGIRAGAAGGPGGQSQFQVPTLPGVDIMGAAQQQYQTDMAGYNAGVAGDNALLGGLMSLAGTFIGMPGAGALLGLGTAAAGGGGSTPAGNGLTGFWGKRYP